MIYNNPDQNMILIGTPLLGLLPPYKTVDCCSGIKAHVSERFINIVFAAMYVHIKTHFR